MEKNILCLANSKKYTQRCIAGIEVVVRRTGLTILREGNSPKWIRPVSKCEHGEIDTQLVDHINILDIFKIHVTANCPDKAQSENVYFSENSIEKISHIKPKPEYLVKLCSETDRIFGNDLPYVTRFEANYLDHSLVFICVDDYSLLRTKTYKGNPQLRANFSYRDVGYDLPITDLDYIQRIDEEFIPADGITQAFITISLGTLFKEKHYKLVAGVILPECE